jgi:hypothetical protein
LGALALAGLAAASFGVGSAGAAAAPHEPTLAMEAPSSSGAALYRAAASFSGPVTVGHVIEPESADPTDLAAHHYVEEEYFASGTAHAFTATSSPSDGRWSIEPTTAATYRTRILVRRPANPAQFSGTVVVEWMNETDGESAPDWAYLNPELMDTGDAWVGVSAQALGVDGGTPILGSSGAQASTKGLVQEEPQRYGSLHHPGDQYALDIFDQVGLGLRSSRSEVLGPLHARHIVAVGESQSAFYLTTFADTLEPLSHAFDGLFIHSRAGGGAGVSARSNNSMDSDVRIRTDLTVPVFMFETQTDLIQLGYAASQQPDTTDIRTWEVAGTSHADEYIVGSPSVAHLLGCTTAINTGPQHEVAEAAFAAFVRWVVDGTPPPSPPRFSLRSSHPASLALDRYGNVIGGVRTPAVDVPVSTLSGVAPPTSSGVCFLFGSTVPFSPSMLASLYGSKAHYLSEYTADLDRAISHGYLLPAERAALLAQAQQVQFPAG